MIGGYTPCDPVAMTSQVLLPITDLHSISRTLYYKGQAYSLTRQRRQSALRFESPTKKRKTTTDTDTAARPPS